MPFTTSFRESFKPFLTHFTKAIKHFAGAFIKPFQEYFTEALKHFAEAFIKKPDPLRLK